MPQLQSTGPPTKETLMYLGGDYIAPRTLTTLTLPGQQGLGFLLDGTGSVLIH